MDGSASELGGSRDLLDPVRAAALAAAVDLCRSRAARQDSPLYASPLVDDVLLIAARFENYLTGPRDGREIAQ